jgi:hypothetical protein
MGSNANICAGGGGRQAQKLFGCGVNNKICICGLKRAVCPYTYIIANVYLYHTVPPKLRTEEKR